jgi:mono/diheme cytochrome c family protein
VKIEALRIVHLLPKSTPLHHKPQIGYGAETNGRAVLGTVPVEEDGSACFLLPPGKSVYFQALDPRGCAVQSMRSATYVQGGQKLTCVGCHERKGRSPAPAPAGVPLAFRREPSEIEPEAEGSNPVSFPRLVQPVLEKHCVRCHGQNAGDPPDLRRGDWRQDTFQWYQSYRSLRPYAFHYGAPRDDKVTNQYDRWQPARTLPGKFGAGRSRLLPLLDKGHYDVRLPPEELRRIIVWLDANSDFFGAYENTEAQARGEPVQPKLQ